MRPLIRRTRLEPGQPLQRTAELSRGAGLRPGGPWAAPVPVMPARRSRDTGPSRKVRELVLDRDGRQCVGCGKPIGEGAWWSMQHRVARGAGGGNSPCNLIVLCGSATSPGCHRLCEDRDREMHARGLWLRSDEDPAIAPVMIASEHGSGVTAWLTDDGRYLFEAPAGAA